MQELKCFRMDEYLARLENCGAVREECERRMMVSISRFWRDRELWLGLEQDILPDLIKKQDKIIKIWSGGCARGEEVYSLKIIWDRLRADPHTPPLLKITATDLNPEYLEMAKSGLYSASSLKELPDDVRDRYFSKKRGKQRYGVKSILKTHIDWQLKHLFDGPPEVGFNIILLRNNLLTYYKNALKKEILLKVISGLKTDGWLIIGSHENIPAGIAELNRHKKIPWAYHK